MVENLLQENGRVMKLECTILGKFGYFVFMHVSLQNSLAEHLVRVEVHTGGSLTDNWINFSFGKYASTCELN
uniref:Uncharacterized protein n=1 Tax=Solanum lycopersicum TaxID=4081 RepID=A0A3Q7EQQ7_SOLLC